MPLAVKSLAAHLGDGDAARWRAAVQVLQLAFPRPVEAPEESGEKDPLNVRSMSSEQRARLRSRIVELHPEPGDLMPSLNTRSGRTLRLSVFLEKS